MLIWQILKALEVAASLAPTRREARIERRVASRDRRIAVLALPWCEPLIARTEAFVFAVREARADLAERADALARRLRAERERV